MSGLLDLSRLMRSGEYSDLTLRCHGQEFKVHKMVVCTQSRVLAAAVQGEYIESKTGVINIPGFDTETVSHMVEFLYTGRYDGTCGNEVSEKEPHAPDDGEIGSTTSPNNDPLNLSMTQHVRVNAIADYYGLTQLADLAKSNIQHLCLNEWNNGTFMEATKEALQFTGDTSLHEIMASAAAEHMTELLDNTDLLDLIGEFGVRILKCRVATVDRDLNEARSKLWQLNAELEQEQAKRRSAELRADRIIENMDKCTQALYETASCRNSSCNGDFDCYIEKHGQVFQPLYTLRCSRCRCRH